MTLRPVLVRWQTWCMVACAALLVVVFAKLLLAPVDDRVQGDEATYVYNAISLRQANLSYDAGDAAVWNGLGWSNDHPVGLFVRANGDGWVFSKPLGYSVVLAPVLWAFGLRGIQITGVLLLAIYAFVWFRLGRLRWAAHVSAALSVAATVFGYAWFYAMPAHADLFLAVLVAVATYASLRAALRGEPRFFWLACAVVGILVTEKLPASFALLPVVAVAAFAVGRRASTIGALVGFAAAVTTIVPNLYYTGGESWSAYGGRRFRVDGVPPWDGGALANLAPVGSAEYFSSRYLAERLLSFDADIPSAALTFLVGRHTGALTFYPLIPALIAVSLPILWRRRHRAGDGADGVDAESRPPPTCVDPDTAPASARRPATDHRLLTWLAWSGLLALVIYASFYVVLFTHNYYGGGHSIGSRYFLQIAPIGAVVPIAVAVPARRVWAAVAFAGVWSLVVLGPHLWRGERMFNELWHSTPVQRLLPFDATQNHFPGYWAGDPTITRDPEGRTWTGAEAESQTGSPVGSSHMVDPARDARGFVAYGQYVRMEPGRYRATFEYASDVPAEQAVGWVDVAHLAVPLEGAQLAGTDGAVATVALDFEAGGEGPWEYRMFWDGTAPLELLSVTVEPIDS